MRRKVQELDRVALGEATQLFATSKNVAGRLERSTGLVAEVLPHPAQELAYRDDGPGDFVLSVNRLDRAKRIDLLIEAAAAEPSLQVVIAGDGPDRRRGSKSSAASAGSTAGCASPGACRPRSWPTSTRRASRPSTPRSTRTSGSGRTSRSSRESR